MPREPDLSDNGRKSFITISVSLSVRTETVIGLSAENLLCFYNIFKDMLQRARKYLHVAFCITPATHQSYRLPNRMRSRLRYC